MFCCIGQKAKNTLNDPNLQTMTASTEFASFEINRELNAEEIIRDILPDQTAAARGEGVFSSDGERRA